MQKAWKCGLGIQNDRREVLLPEGMRQVIRCEMKVAEADECIDTMKELDQAQGLWKEKDLCLQYSYDYFIDPQVDWFHL